jgi:hypothetical protein
MLYSKPQVCAQTFPLSARLICIADYPWKLKVSTLNGTVKMSLTFCLLDALKLECTPYLALSECFIPNNSISTFT